MEEREGAKCVGRAETQGQASGLRCCRVARAGIMNHKFR